MNISIIYPHIVGLTPGFQYGKPANLEGLRQSVVKFVQSYNQFPPDYPHEVIVVCCHGEPTDEVREFYRGMSCRFLTYYGMGWDTGAQQEVGCREDVDFALCITARTHFHRRGWLKRLAEAVENRGDGLYGAMASYEGFPFTPRVMPNPHIRTGFYGLYSHSFRRYPNKVTNRDETFHFESGNWNISTWFEMQNLPALMVTWDGAYARPDWRKPPNIFRRGDQTNLIAWDRHTEIYSNLTDPSAIRQHENLANGLQAEFVP
jgi:hypothetical protein